MIKEISEKIVKLDKENLKNIEIYFILFFVLTFLLGYFSGYVISNIETQKEITNKLVSLSEKEGELIPNNNYFKIDNKIYEIKKVNIPNETLKFNGSFINKER